MMQSRTHNCNQLRIENVGEKVKLVGWMENVREVGGNLAFVVLRDFYGTTQVVVEDEADLKVIKGINKESTISVEGTVRERASKNSKQATGEIEVVPEKIEVLGRCRYNSLPFEINRSREADETQRLKPESARATRRVAAERNLRAWGRRNGIAVSILRAPGIYAADRLPLERLREINQPSIDWFAEYGIDLTKGDLIEVAACAQHFQGGIKIDALARTTVPFVWAAGETAGGQHGAYRYGRYCGG